MKKRFGYDEVFKIIMTAYFSPVYSHFKKVYI